MSGTGRLVRLTLTAGQRGDSPQAPGLIAGLSPKWVIADAGYCSRANRAAAKAAGARACVKPNPTRKPLPRYNERRYRSRNVVERFFRRLKDFRRAATRYEKKAENFAGMVWLAAFTINFGVHTT